jgi:hypothetical protein
MSCCRWSRLDRPCGAWHRRAYCRHGDPSLPGYASPRTRVGCPAARSRPNGGSACLTFPSLSVMP